MGDRSAPEKLNLADRLDRRNVIWILPNATAVHKG